MTYEQDRALMEGHRNAATESYFQARPVLDARDIRRAYEAAYAKAWEDCSALASAPAAEPVPTGWRLVPVEPTADMIAAGRVNLNYASATAKETWAGMMCAAPPPAQASDPQAQVVGRLDGALALLYCVRNALEYDNTARKGGGWTTWIAKIDAFIGEAREAVPPSEQEGGKL